MNHGVAYESLMKLEAWIRQSNWKGYDTFDGLSSPYAKLLTLNRPFLKQCWQQGVRRFPFNLRPLLGIKRNVSSKAMGFFAQGYLRLHQTYGKPEFLEKMRFCLQWLMDHRSPNYRGHCWGNHFDYQHRAGSIAKGEPTIVWTGLIGHAFLDAYEWLQEPGYLDVAKSVCEFIANEIGYSKFGDEIYLHYYPGATHVVHNSNMIGASILARVHYHAPNDNYLQLSRKAVAWTMRHQLPSGGWYYGVGPFEWIDSFHTGYVLEALDIFNRCSKTRDFEAHLEKGYRYYVDTFFEADGTPRYYHHKKRPLDIQCASQGIQTLVNLRRMHPESVTIAKKVAAWTKENMQDRTGYFYYRNYPLVKNKTVTMHWGQATMFAALALLNQHLQAGDGSEAKAEVARGTA